MIVSSRREKRNFVNEYVKALNNERGALFAGAGLSIPSGGISWSELLRDEADSIGIDVSRENDLISVAQFIYNESGTRQTITQLLKNKIVKSGKVNENHEILSSLPIKKAWTTNYDEFLERSFSNTGKIVDLKKSVQDMATELEHTDVTVYKMHGDIGIPNSTVLLKDDYEIYDKKNELFTKTLQTDLLSNTFLFIGFSFDDPNLESILSKVRIMLEGNPRRHYCILKKVNKNDPEFSQIDKEEKEKEYEYRWNKQQLKIADLMRYGIKAILVDSYDEITDLLKSVKRKYLSNKVFISGAYDEVESFLGYTDEEARELADKFCEKLGETLFDEQFEISTGFGLGVGRNLITGFLNKEASQGNIRLGSNLIIRPFPIQQKEEDKRKYREKILSECGVSIFLFGNRQSKTKEDENIIDSPGVREEYEISRKLGHFIIPVGVTGYMSEKLWNRQKLSISEHLSSNEVVIDSYRNLNNEEQEIDELIESIIALIKEYQLNPDTFVNLIEEV